VYQGELGQPGTRPDIKTFVEPQDEAVLTEAVQRAKSEADLVILSCHWGIHQAAVTIADYESRLGQAAIDAGADVVVGHHQHILKGVEVYRGGVILHGLGNFVCDLRIASKLTPEQLRDRVRRYGEYAVAPRDDYPAYPFHPDARNTMIAQIRAGGGKPMEVELVPCHINPAGQPVLLTAEDPQFEVAVEYIQHTTREAELPAEFKLAGDVLKVVTD
jgi:poly-gamma-glutamate synthesis protein (capsule biosynthesis protein)